MRPIKIEISGFRSFGEREPGVVDFRGLSTAAVVGDTGSGKSSILEALTYALYGETSKGSKVLRHVMNDDAQRMRVVLDFEAQGDIWRVDRSARRRKDGTAAGDGAVLARNPGGTEPEIVAEQVRAVDERTAELVGMDCAAFLRTTVLPQGRFGRLLAEDDQRVRSTVLRQIWRTEELDDAARWVEAEAKSCELLDAATAHERSNHPEDIEGRELELERLSGEAAAAAAASKLELDEFNGAVETRRTAVETAEKHERAAAAVDGLKHRWPGTRIAACAAETARLAEVLTTRRRELAAIETAAGPPPPAGAARRRGGMLTQLRTAARCGGTCAETARETARTGTDADTAAAAAAEAESRNGAPGPRPERDQTASEGAVKRQRTAAAAEGAAAETARAAETPFREAVTIETVTLRRARTALKNCTANAAAARREVERRAAERKTAETVRGGARRKLAAAAARNAAAAACAGHGPGDPCPVCDRTLPPGFTAPEAGGLQAAETAARDAEREAEAAARRESRAAADCAAAEANVAAAAAGERTARADRRRLLEKAAAAAGARPDPGWTDEEVESAASAVVEEVGKAAVETAAEADEVRSESEAAVRTAADSAAAWNQAKRDVRTTAEKARRARNTATEAAHRDRAEAERWAESAAAVADPAARARIEAAGAGGTSACAARSRSVIEEIGTGLAAEERRDAERAASSLEAHTRVRTAAEAAENHRRTTAEPLKGGIEEIRRLFAVAAAEAGWSGDSGGAAEPAFHAVAGLRRRAAAAARRAASDASRRIADAAGGVPAHEMTARLKEHADRTAQAAAAAAAKSAEYSAKVPAVKALDRLAAATAGRKAELAELKSALMPGSFPKYVTLRRSARLLANASRHLREMTADRYGFKDPRDTEERWRILDRVSGAERDPGQLSGGEQFLAALALSLGMIETVDRTGGSIRTLFIDEGFGTLDRSCLDLAVAALRKALDRGHLIVLVSHVREVAAAVDDVIVVDRTPGGTSRVHRCDALELEQFRAGADIDAGGAGTGAAAGLLSTAPAA